MQAADRPAVAVTGAAGRIGRDLVEHLAARGYPLTLVDLPGRGLSSQAHHGAVVEIDLASPPPPRLFAGSEVVIHLAGEPHQDATWERLLPANIEASYNVARAAIDAGCRRLIAASSVHAVAASQSRPVVPEGPVAPANLYGVTKCFVEALAFWCAHQGRMSAAAVRIGGYHAPGRDVPSTPDMVIAAPDLMTLLELAIGAQYRFAILHAAAPGPGALLDTRATEQLLAGSPGSDAPTP